MIGIDDDLWEMDEDELRETAMTLRENEESWSIEKEIKERDMRKYRERLERRDSQIGRMVQCLRAIAGDDDGNGRPTPCLHDAMAKDCLKHYRATRAAAMGGSNEKNSEAVEVKRLMALQARESVKG